MFENLPILKVFHPPLEVDKGESGGFTYFRVCEGGDVMLGDDEGKVIGETYSYFHSSILSLLASMLLVKRI